LFRRLVNTGLPYLAWLLIAAVVFMLFWPAMWVDPIGTLQEMIGEAFSYTLEGNQNVFFFNGRIYASGESAWYFYPFAWLWRTTPLVLGGLIAAGISLWKRISGAIPDAHKRFAAVLGLYALSFGFVVSLAGQKYDRYLLPAMLALILLAGLGWYWVLDAFRDWLRGRMSANVAPWVVALAGIALLGGQLWGAIDTYPYYLQYYNPLLGGLRRAQDNFQIGWGEGLDQAARYLNLKPDSKRLRVVSWYGDAPFGYYFDGVTVNMAADAGLEELMEADYIVLYHDQIQRRLPSPQVLDYFAAIEPEYTVTINSLPYAQVFNRDDLPEQ
jgi:hypothetical protein